MDPNILAAFKTLYIPTLSFDSGKSWEYLQPVTELHEAKRRLKSRLPSTYTASKGKAINIKCGLLIARTQSLVDKNIFIELVAKDLVNDMNLPD